MDTLLRQCVRNAHRRRAMAQDQSKFDADAASPFDASADPYVMPARSRLAFSTSVDAAAGDATVSINGKDYLCPALAADQLHRIDVAERNAQVVLTGTLVGTVTLYTLDQWSRPRAIATATFA